MWILCISGQFMLPCVKLRGRSLLLSAKQLFLVLSSDLSSYLSREKSAQVSNNLNSRENTPCFECVSIRMKSLPLEYLCPREGVQSLHAFCQPCTPPMSSWKASLWITLNCHITANPAKQPVQQRENWALHLTQDPAVLASPSATPALRAGALPAVLPLRTPDTAQPGLWPPVCVNRTAFFQCLY